jgi:hypothetical protein
MPPGLVVDGQSVVSGHLLSVHQVKWILTGRAKAESSPEKASCPPRNNRGTPWVEGFFLPCRDRTFSKPAGGTIMLHSRLDVQKLGVGARAALALGREAGMAQVEESEARLAPCNIDDRNAEEELLPIAMDKGIATLINGPFGRTRLFTRVEDRKRMADLIDALPEG